VRALGDCPKTTSWNLGKRSRRLAQVSAFHGKERREGRNSRTGNKHSVTPSKLGGSSGTIRGGGLQRAPKEVYRARTSPAQESDKSCKEGGLLQSKGKLAVCAKGKEKIRGGGRGIDSILNAKASNLGKHHATTARDLLPTTRAKSGRNNSLTLSRSV